MLFLQEYKQHRIRERITLKMIVITDFKYVFTYFSSLLTMLLMIGQQVLCKFILRQAFIDPEIFDFFADV